MVEAIWNYVGPSWDCLGHHPGSYLGDKHFLTSFLWSEVFLGIVSAVILDHFAFSWLHLETSGIILGGISSPGMEKPRKGARTREAEEEEGVRRRRLSSCDPVVWQAMLGEISMTYDSRDCSVRHAFPFWPRAERTIPKIILPERDVQSTCWRSS